MMKTISKNFILTIMFSSLSVTYDRCVSEDVSFGICSEEKYSEPKNYKLFYGEDKVEAAFIPTYSRLRYDALDTSQ